MIELPECMGKLQIEGLRNMELVSQKWESLLMMLRISDQEQSQVRNTCIWFEFHLSDSSLTQLSHFSFSLCTVVSFVFLLQITAFREMIVKRSLTLQIFVMINFFLLCRYLVKGHLCRKPFPNLKDPPCPSLTPFIPF